MNESSTFFSGQTSNRKIPYWNKPLAGHCVPDPDKLLFLLIYPLRFEWRLPFAQISLRELPDHSHLQARKREPWLGWQPTDPSQESHPWVLTGRSLPLRVQWRQNVEGFYLPMSRNHSHPYCYPSDKFSLNQSSNLNSAL